MAVRVSPDGFIDYTAPDGWARAYPPGADLTGAPDEVIEAAQKSWPKPRKKALKPRRK